MTAGGDFKPGGGSNRDDAMGLLDRICDGSKSLLALTGSMAADPEESGSSIRALASSMENFAEQVSVLTDQQDRLEAQYLRRLCEMLGENAKGPDVLRVLALGISIQRSAETLMQSLAWPKGGNRRVL